MSGSERRRKGLNPPESRDAVLHEFVTEVGDSIQELKEEIGRWRMVGATCVGHPHLGWAFPTAVLHCWKCEQPGHVIRDCWPSEASTSGQPPLTGGTCGCEE